MPERPSGIGFPIATLYVNNIARWNCRSGWNSYAVRQTSHGRFNQWDPADSHSFADSTSAVNEMLMTSKNQVIPYILEGRLAFITGAGQGNGREIALGLSKAGARVIVTDINESALENTAQAIRAQCGTVWSFVLNVTHAGECLDLAQLIESEIGQVDLLVNNAGIIIREGSESPNAARNWQRTFDVNVNGTFNVTQAFLPALRAKRGSILNIASVAAFAGMKGSLGYAPSKGAIKMYTQSLAAELAEDGIRVNALAPGLIATPMNAAERENPEWTTKFMDRIPMGRMGQPSDLIGPVVFLSSSMSEFITGVTLVVDGGFLAT